LNIWVTDENASVGLLGYATFPPLTTLTGLTGGYGTAISDGFWSWAKSFGSSTIFPGGTYSAPYDKGRTCTHEIGHWLGLRHIWGDGSCLTDYCNDTPPATGSNFGSPTYPLNANSCAAATPPTGPNGQMFMNFMDYTDDLAMYMFTADQRVRMHVAMQNSPYRKFLGTHGLCNLPAPIANFTVAPNPVCEGATVNAGDLSLNIPTSWSYTMAGGTPSLSSAQNPTVSYASSGIYTITLVASNTAGPSAPVSKTISVIAGPAFVLTSNPAAILCAGNNLTITPSGATTYTLLNTGSTTPPFVTSPTVATIYSVTAITSGTNTCPKTQTIAIAIGSIAIVVTPTAPSVCSGQSVALTGSGASTYTWSTGSNAVTINVTPTATTIYTVNGTNLGCSGTKTVQVTLNPTPVLTANNATICAGGTATLTAGGANTYLWNTAANTSVITVTPAVNTVYSFTGTTAFGCTNTKTVSVTIGTGLGLTIIATPTVLCIGGSATLTVSGASTYTWSTTQNGASIVVTPAVAGTANYTVNGTSGTCNGTQTLGVVVNALATTAVAGSNQTICVSSPSTTLSGNIPAVGTGSWSLVSGVGTIVSPTSPASNVTGIATAGLNVFQWKITNGACSSISTMTVVSNALPTVASAIPSQTVCVTITTLTGNAPTIGTGVWSLLSGTGSIASPNSTSTGITGLGLGTNVFQWTISNGVCAPSVSSVSVTASSSPTVTAVTAASLICNGSSVNLTAVGATTYSWSTGATTSVIAVTPPVTSSYTVTGINGSCSSYAIVTQSVSACTKVSQIANAVYDVVVYPNPFKEELNISVGELVTAQVFNTLGQLIIVKAINVMGTINTSELAKGVYYVNVKGISGSKTLKIVKD
ncbi:MAG: T9SS type A sorting domain-containing protein, partial [Bacteroidota bacterium]